MVTAEEIQDSEERGERDALSCSVFDTSRSWCLYDDEMHIFPPRFCSQSSICLLSLLKRTVNANIQFCILNKCV